MNWISNYVRPKINAIFSKKDTPENLWIKCLECGMMLFHREVKDALHVCSGCGHHMQISPHERLVSLFDGGIYSAVESDDVLEDPLQFKDTKKYTDRIKDTRKITGEKDAVATEDGGQYAKGDPIYQQIDHSKLVPLLVAALQEAIGRIEALEAG